MQTGQVFKFNCIDDSQSILLPPGKYKLECYGAAGGSKNPGKGGYTKGVIKLEEQQMLYIYVGGKGISENWSEAFAGGYNGGGKSNYNNRGSGGGATDIRLKSGNFNNYNSLNTRLIVAGGGGGSYENVRGGDGGRDGEAGRSSNGVYGEGGSQSSGGSFIDVGNKPLKGHGNYGEGGSSYDNYTIAGGGGGWYGGGAGNSAGGGSSYAVNSSSYKPSGYDVDSKYYLSEIEFKTGVNDSDGYCIITCLELYSPTKVNCKIDGVIREVDKMSVKVDGSWRDVDSIYVKIDGNWKKSE